LRPFNLDASRRREPLQHKRVESSAKRFRPPTPGRSGTEAETAMMTRSLVLPRIQSRTTSNTQYSRDQKLFPSTATYAQINCVPQQQLGGTNMEQIGPGPPALFTAISPTPTESTSFGSPIKNEDGSLQVPPTKKQKRNKPTLSCFECVERKTKVSHSLFVNSEKCALELRMLYPISGVPIKYCSVAEVIESKL